MTDSELLSRVLGALDCNTRRLYGLNRGSNLLLALPRDREAAAIALRLYQPQRKVARLVAALVRGWIRLGLTCPVLSTIEVTPARLNLTPTLPRSDQGTCGVLLGSPEHRIRRAVASFRSGGEWQVAKIAFGPAGRGVIDGEADAIGSLPQGTPGVPKMRGVHHGNGMSLLRLPHIKGRVLRRDEMEDALDLLDSWRSALDAKPLPGFPEWPAIKSAIQKHAVDCDALEPFENIELVPSVRHGDFARWNLIRPADGSIVALDWEWGQSNGMPGLDLAHFLLQDALLVDRMKPAAAIRDVLRRLDHGGCRDYLRKSGWTAKPLLPVIASLAFKQGSKQQDTAMALEAALRMLRSGSVL